MLRTSPLAAWRLPCHLRPTRITTHFLRGDRTRPCIRGAARHLRSHSSYKPPREDAERRDWPAGNPVEEIGHSLRELADLSVLSPKWGFVVYRGVHGAESDSKWDQAMRTIQETVRDGVEKDYYRGEFFKSFESTILKAHTSSPSTPLITAADVRAQFSEWVYNDIRTSISNPQSCRETLQREKPWLPIRSQESVDMAPIEDLEALTPRWQYCLYLDQLCLDSFSKGHPQVVMVVARDSDPYRCGKKTGSPVVKDCSCYDDDGWMYPEIDGCRCYDVGWMYMDLWEYMRFYIDCLENNCHWGDIYARPPYTTQVEIFGPQEVHRSI